MNQQSMPDPADDARADQSAGPELQGEGNITAARNHRQSVKRFLDKGQVDAAADAAAPSSPQEARELQDAEEAGRSHARS